MKNPLIKRLPRELKDDMGKYIVIFVFMTLTIGVVSGFLVADSSIINTYNESFEKYNIEDGNFELNDIANEELTRSIEEDGVLLYENFYMEKPVIADDKTEAVLRIFKNRDEVNKVCIMKGELPKSEDEIALDRLFALNNNIKVGDIINVSDKELRVSGYVALSDYSAMFENNNDIIFDATKFGVAVMTDGGFANFADGLVHYNYSWKYNEMPDNESREIEKATDFLFKLNSKVCSSNIKIINYIPRYTNQAINFSGNDMGNDKSMIIVFLYILIVIMAFVFAITTNNTINKEASVIGTLRASGYTRRELLLHYISTPIATTFVAAITGNIMGYTFLRNIMAGLYYNSYSLIKYKTLWNFEAFLITTVIPIIIMIIINILVISSKLKMSPLKFLRHDLSKSKKKKAIRLPKIGFLSRYRLRVIFQNIPNYITLFIGIVFSNVLLLFGVMVPPLLNHFSDESVNNMISGYQYILKIPVETGVEGAEKYCISSLETTSDKFKHEEITIYGVQDNSKYIDLEIKNDEVYISNLYADKYGLKKGDTVKLKDKYSGHYSSFKIKGIYDYPASMALFTSREYFNNIFGNDTEYFNGWFTDEKLEDIDETYIMSVIDEDDMTRIARQMKLSMGDMMEIVKVVSLVLSGMLIYLLTKIIIEKNSISISMIKILGYNNSEVGRVYLLSTSFVVVISMALSLVFATFIIKLLWTAIMSDMTGWIIFWVKPSLYPFMFIMGIGVYVAVMVLQYFKITKIPMSEALKNIE